MPFPVPIPSSILFIDLLASAEIREEAQPQSVTGPSQAPGPRDNEMDTDEGGHDRCPSVIENVDVEILTTNSMSVLLDSKEFTSLAMFSAGGESEQTVESPWSHCFASANARATISTPLPTVPRARSIEGKRSSTLWSRANRPYHKHSHHDYERRTARIAKRREPLDCKASEGVVHRLDCAHHCGWHNFIPWRLCIRRWHNIRTSRGDHCWRDRGCGRKVAEACTEFRCPLGCSASTSADRRSINHRGRGRTSRPNCN